MNDPGRERRVAVITGASSGIGEGTARTLAAAGYRVALLARRADRIDALAKDLGNGAIAIEADVTDREAIRAAAERVNQELGGADVLVNNAGVMLLGPFSAEQHADYQQMIDVNLLGAITTTEIFLDQLKDGGGDIVNISSVAGRTAGRKRRLRRNQVGHQWLYSQVQVTADDIAEVIGFAVSRLRRLAIHEILLRPAGQQL